MAVILGVKFLMAAYKVYTVRDDASETAAKQLFGFSILYLFVLFAAMLAEAMLRQASGPGERAL